VDWNNDGRKDLITGEYDGHIRIYLNVGTDVSPVFTNYTYLQVGGAAWTTSYSIPEVVDWNNDGKKDLLVGNSSGNVMLLLNTGTDASPSFSAARYITNGSAPLVASSRAGPVVVDWNRDGKKDLIVGGYDGNLWYYENRGTDANPVFSGYVLLTAGGKTINVGYYSKPEAVDWDNDGWLDLLVGSYEYSEDSSVGHVFYFHALSGPYLKSYTLRDANANGFLERDEVCSLTTVLTNTGSTVTGVVATLSTTSPWCSITTPDWSVGDSIPYKSITNTAQPFRFTIATNAPFGATLPFTLKITGNDGRYQQTHSLRFEVARPSFSVSAVLVNDAAGNGDCACNPGETVQLLVKLKNTGYRAEGVTGQLACTGPSVVMLNSNTAFGTIERNAQAVAWQAPFAFTVPSSMPTNAIYGFTLNVSYRDGGQTTNLPIYVGDYNVTSNTPFAWVTPSPATAVSLTDESYSTLPLGFNFSLYGARPTNYLRLVSNGYLMFGNPYVVYSLSTIPLTNQPNLLIAPWGEDLDPGKGGSIRYQLYGTAPNRYWVAQWANVPRYYYTNDLRNFQVILYESGAIKFQYGTNTGSASWPGIGLENADGTRGKAWTSKVTNGVALLFSPQGGSADSDQDGLPDAWETFCLGNLTCCGTDDSDRDGLCNLAEFRTGTDPTQAASGLRIDEFRLLSPAQGLLRWRSIPGKPYTVWLGASPITQPQLSLGSFLAGSAPRIHIEAEPVLPYVLYWASDLRDWTSLYTNFSGGPTDFTDAQGSNRSCRFYRAGVLSQNGWTKLTVTPVVGAADGTNYYTNALPPAGGNLRLSTP
jgi:hypothetical protein